MCAGTNDVCPGNGVCQSLEFALMAVGIPVGTTPDRSGRCADVNPWCAENRPPVVAGSAPAELGSPRQRSR